MSKVNDEFTEEKEKKGISSNSKWGIAFILELIIIAVMSLFIVKNYVHDKYGILNVENIDEKDLGINEGVKIEGYTNIALFGMDSRDGSLGEGNRSDSIMIASINNKTKDVKIVSVFRDTTTELQNEDKDIIKVNAAYAYGGPKMAVQTLNANFDLNISEYVSINWEGMIRAVDQLGGVDIHIEEEEIEYVNEYIKDIMVNTGIASDGVYNTGDQTLNGVQATAYCRIRYTGMGDITRTERQREVITQMLDKLKKSDFKTIDAIIDEVFPYISTSITEKEMTEFAKGIMSYDLKDTVGFPFRYEFYDSESLGSCIAAQDLSDNVKALHRYLFGNDSYSVSENQRRINDSLSSFNEAYSTGEKILLPGEEDKSSTSKETEADDETEEEDDDETEEE